MANLGPSGLRRELFCVAVGDRPLIAPAQSAPFHEAADRLPAPDLPALIATSSTEGSTAATSEFQQLLR
jgi:hypothetical protein